MNHKFKINFIVFSQFPNYIDYIGGSVVSHTIANQLASLGENVYLYANSTPFKNVNLINWGQEVSYDPRNTVVILTAGNGEHTFEKDVPDFIKKCPNIIRHLVNQQVAEYPDSNKIYSLGPYFRELATQKLSGYLPILNVDYDIFKNQNLNRSGRCFLIKGDEYIKNQPIHHNAYDFNIDNYWSYTGDRMKYLADVFNKHEIFFTYNQQTFISVLAALCGCVSVIIPHSDYGKEKVMKFPQNKFGIAYGFDDIQHSKDTMHLVEPHIKSIQQEHINQTKQFITDCYNWLQTKYNI
jgi:hypothetical protein